MVNKTFRCGVWTGNTIRLGIWRNYTTNDGYLEFQTYNADNEWDLDDALWELDDGLQEESKPLLDQFSRGLNSSPKDKEHVQFSLNKRKRWLFEEEMEHDFYYFQRKDFFRVVVVKREMVMPHTFMFTFTRDCRDAWVNRHCNVCATYMDSKAFWPITKYVQSDFSDLRKATCGQIKPPKVRERRREKESRRRGTQRKSDIIRRLPETQRENKAVQYKNEGLISDDDFLELRYTIFEPMFTSRFRPQRLLNWMFLRSRELRRYSLVRRHYLSKKSWSKQKGCVNGRKVKRWQKWDPKDRDECVHSSSMIQTSANGAIDKKVLENTRTFIQGFSPHHHGYNMVTVEKKSTFDVNMEDLIWKSKENQINRHRTKLSRKGRPEIKRENSYEPLNAKNERHKKRTEISIEDSNQSSFIYCQIKNSEFSDFSDSVQRSVSCYPPIFYIPVDGSGDDSGNSSTDISLTPGLLLQELASPAVNGPLNQTRHYRLKLHVDNDHIRFKELKEKLSAYVCSRRSAPSSLTKNYGFTRSAVNELYQYTEEKQFYVSKVNKPLFDWMSSVAYRISTVEQVYQSCLSRNEIKNSLPPLCHSVDSKMKISECRMCLKPVLEDTIYQDGFLLLPCQHFFCRNCLYQYVIVKLGQGSSVMKCPEYGCKSSIDKIVTSFLVPYTLSRSWGERQRERMVVTVGQWRPCPKESCSRIVYVSEKLSSNGARIQRPKSLSERREVTCVCNTEFCMDCQQPPHWPASCIQAESYVTVISHVSEVDDIPITRKPSDLKRDRYDEKISKTYSTVSCKESKSLSEHDTVDKCCPSFKWDINSPTNYTEKAMLCRIMQKKLLKWKKTRFGHVQIKHRVPLNDTSKTRKHPRKLQNGVGTRIVEFRYLNTFIKTLKLLENIYVSIPPAPKGFHSRRLTKFHEVGNQVDTSAKQMIDILMFPALVDNGRLQTLMGFLSDKLCELYLLSVWVGLEFNAADQ